MKKLFTLFLVLMTIVSFSACTVSVDNENFSDKKLSEMPIYELGDETGLWKTETSQTAFGFIEYLNDEFVTISVQDINFSFLLTEDAKKDIEYAKDYGIDVKIGTEVGITPEEDKNGIMSALRMEFPITNKAQAEAEEKANESAE